MFWCFSSGVWWLFGCVLVTILNMISLVVMIGLEKLSKISE